MPAQSCHPLLGAEHWASPHSPFRDQEAVSGSICTKIAKVLSLTSFKNGDIFIALFHHPPQYTKHFTNEEISASACALLLSMAKKTKRLLRYCSLFSCSTITYIHKEYKKLFFNQLLRESRVIYNFTDCATQKKDSCDFSSSTSLRPVCSKHLTGRKLSG